MALAFYLVPMKRDDFLLGPTKTPGRYCAMNDFTSQIRADGGAWAETEVLGGRAIVKVRASLTLLTTIAGTAGFRRIPLNRLNDPLSSLSTTQRQALKQELLDAGYTVEEFQARFPGGLATVTLGDVLRFMATRRLKPRYNSGTDEIILDGPIQSVRSLASVDAEVT